MTERTDDCVTCPKCQTVIDPTERCEALRGSGRCMEYQGHEGFHWSDVGMGNGGVLVWFGPFYERRCAGRLDLTRWCKKPPGHDGEHNDGRGMTWSEIEDDDEEELRQRSFR